MRVPDNSPSVCFFVETLTTFPSFPSISSLISSFVRGIQTHPSITLIFTNFCSGIGHESMQHFSVFLPTPEHNFSFCR